MTRFVRFVLWFFGLILIAYAVFGRTLEGPGEIGRIFQTDAYNKQYPAVIFSVVTLSLILFSEVTELGFERQGWFWKFFAAAGCLLCVIFLPIFAIWYGGAPETAQNAENISVSLWVLLALACLAIVAKLARLTR